MKRMVDEDDYREAASYASKYFTEKWGLLDGERFKTLTPIGWLDPGSKRFCYADEKEAWPEQRQGFTQAVYIIEEEQA